ncbi:MAG: hypothetical protein NTY32_09750 [Bacteroidia bacterium]|nr:hypothetical protein [Bacteroidia bacterium]
MKIVLKIIAIAFITNLSVSVSAQKKLAEFPFELNDRAINVHTAIGLSFIQIMVATPDVLVQTPIVMADGDVNALFFQFKGNYGVATNNISFAIAPKQGSNVRITHLEFRVRFGSTNTGNAGVFMSKDSTKIM